jgi:hypothetical protein
LTPANSNIQYNGCLHSSQRTEHSHEFVGIPESALLCGSLIQSASFCLRPTPVPTHRLRRSSWIVG